MTRLSGSVQRDGFVIYDRETDGEIDFIACTKDGRMREKVEDGLLLRVDHERFYFSGTREDRDA